MEILSIMPWIWLGILVVLIIIEALTQGLTTIWGAASALVMVFVSRTELALGWQLLIFISLTLALLVTTRPFLVKKLKLGKDSLNVGALPGQEVVVTKAITKFGKGEARTRNGVIWTASSEDESDIAEGDICVVRSVEGNTLVLGRKGGEA